MDICCCFKGKHNRQYDLHYAWQVSSNALQTITGIYG